MGKVTICLLTYKRTDYAEQTLRAVLDRVMYSGQISVHIADDGSPPEHRARLYDVAGGYSNVKGVSVSNTERAPGGYGHSYNLAMQTTHQQADYVLPLEDDWVLTRPLDLDPLVRALDIPHLIGVESIRLGYLSFTQALHGRVMSAPPEWYKYLLFNPNSDEPHVFAGHPRLETVAYQRRVGLWPVGLAAGQTEFTVAHNPEARKGVAWPMDLVHPRGDLFAHIGTVGTVELTDDRTQVTV